MSARGELTKLSFNSPARAVAALELAATLTGDSETDTANRALQVYAALLSVDVGQTVRFDLAPGVYVQFQRLEDAP